MQQARVLARSDADQQGEAEALYDALVTAHRYKLAWSSTDAVRFIVAGRGAQFEPRVVDALVEVIAAREAASESTSVSSDR